MSYKKSNANGQATMANSEPVVIASDQSAVPVTPGGNVAHDAVDAGSPIKVGGKASTGVTTPVADADRVDAWLDENGRQVMSDKDTELGVTSGTTGLRDRLVAQRCTVLADSLADGISTFWTSSAANGGTATSTVGEGQLKTSTATNGSIQLVSTTVTYYPGQVNWLNSAVRFNDTGTAGNIRRLGMFTVSGTTPQDGFYFELSGTTLNAVYVKAGSATAVASTSWSRNAVAPFTLDTNYHSFEIRYTANSVWFYVDNVLRHAVSGTSTPLTTTLSFPITIQNIKTSGATDITFAVRNIGNGRFGHPGGVVAETGLSAVEAIAVGGGTPHDAVDSGNPLKIGAKAEANLSTATMVADGDRTSAYADLDGALLVRNSRPLGDMLSERTTDTAGTSVASTAFGATASTRNVITGFTVYNSSATAGYLDFRDGTAGTILWTAPLPAGGGSVMSLPDGIFRTSANTALAYDVSAALSTVYISVTGFKSKV